MNAVLHIAISIAHPAAEVHVFVADPRNLPLWAAGLARSEVLPEGDAWVARAPFGTAHIRFAPPNPYGVLDHEVRMESGLTVLNPMRVLPNGEGSEFIFTLIRRPDMTDAEFDADRAAIEADLAALKGLMERPGPLLGRHP